MKKQGIYILTCRPTGMSYVGQSVDLKKRLKQHQSGHRQHAIGTAIRKYGFDAFDVEILEYPGISQDALNTIEKWKIIQLNTKSPHGYNLTDGGDINPMDDPKVRAHQKKVSGAKTAEMNRIHRKRDRQHVTERNNRNWQDPEYRKKMRNAISESNRKRWRDPEYRKRMSEHAKNGLSEEENKQRRKEQDRKRNKTEKRRAADRVRNKTEKRREYQRNRNKQPKRKAYKKDYYQKKKAEAKQPHNNQLLLFD